MRILIVDDDQDFCNSTGEVVEGAGHEVLCAYSQQEAAQILRREGQQIDVALIDMKLHGDDKGGLKLIRLVAEHRLRVVPIVVTGYGEIENSVECMRAGAFDYIQKGGTSQVDLVRFALRRVGKMYDMTHRANLYSTEIRGIVGDLEDVVTRLQRVAEAMRQDWEGNDGGEGAGTSRPLRGRK